MKHTFLLELLSFIWLSIHLVLQLSFAFVVSEVDMASDIALVFKTFQ